MYEKKNHFGGDALDRTNNIEHEEIDIISNRLKINQEEKHRRKLDCEKIGRSRFQIVANVAKPKTVTKSMFS